MGSPFEALRRLAADYPIHTKAVMVVINFFVVLALNITVIRLEGLTVELVEQAVVIALMFALGMYVFIRYM